MLYYLNVTVHILAAVFWLGGMFFLALVGAPVLRNVEPPALRARLFGELGRRYRVVGWIAITVLVLTGVGNLHFRGILSLSILSSPEFWGSPYGIALAWKLGSVAAMLLFQGLHDFILGPAASRLPPGTPAMAKARRRATLLARGSALLGIVVVMAAVRLARGG